MTNDRGSLDTAMVKKPSVIPLDMKYGLYSANTEDGS